MTKTSEVVVDKDRYDYLDKGSLKDFVREFLMRNDQFMADYRNLARPASKGTREERDEIYRKYRVFVPPGVRNADTGLEMPIIDLPRPVIPHRLIDGLSMSERKKYIEETINTAKEALNSKSYEVLDNLRLHVEPTIDDAKDIIECLLGRADRDGCYQCGDKLVLSLNLNYSKDILLSEIEKILHVDKQKPRRKGNQRDDKWKYYLIVYDLVKKYGMTYDSIGDALLSAYPYRRNERKDSQSDERRHNSFDAKNIENYYKAALTLINGGYKKYL